MFMNDSKEQQMLAKRFLEMANTAYHKEICVYTDFLNLNEVSIFHSIEKELPPIGYSYYGGYSSAERVMICFHGDIDQSGNLTDTSYRNTSAYPITLLLFQPASAKFAPKMNHRDYLGTIMGQSIQRSKIGDILVQEKGAYIFCCNVIAKYLTEQITQVGHTKVKGTIVDCQDMIVQPEYEQITQSVSSLRLDVMIALAFHASRSSIVKLIEGEKVFVNARQIISNSYCLKPGDIVSVRGYGKFVFHEIGNLSKKGRTYVTLLRYK